MAMQVYRDCSALTFPESAHCGFRHQLVSQDADQRADSVHPDNLCELLSLQIFAQEAVTNVTLVSTASLAMIFTPSFFRGPPTSKIFDVASSGTHEDINKVFNEARIEQQFMLNLVEFLDVTRLEDEDDWIPTHGKHNSIGSSLSSSTASSAYPASSAHPYFSEVGMQGESRPSLESTTSTLSQSSRPSFGSTKRKNRFHRTRMQTAEPSRETFGTQEHSTAPGLSTSASYPIRSRAITDSFFVHGQSRSIKDLSDRLHSINHASSPPPLPDLPFIKPVIVVNEAD